MTENDHVVTVEYVPFGGTRSERRLGTLVRVRCSCGAAVETGDNWGKHNTSEIAARLRHSIRHRPPESTQEAGE